MTPPAIDIAARAAATAPLSDDDARIMLARLGLPVEAMMAVRARFYACVAKHGVAPGSSRPDRTPDDHYSAAMRHLGVIASGGYDLLIPDLDDPGTHLAAAMCRGLLALEGVMAEIEGKAGDRG